MRRSTDRILTTHAGSLPRPPDLQELLGVRRAGQPYDTAAWAKLVPPAVASVVARQCRAGMDVVNDGEFSKPNFLHYARERLSGIEERPVDLHARQGGAGISGRDARDFPEYFAEATGRRQIGADLAQRRIFCTGPLAYIGQGAVRADVENLRASLEGAGVEDAFITAIAPGTIEHWLGNAYYPTQGDFLFAVAEALREEYTAIVGAGFVLQIDDPGLVDSWQMHPDMSVGEYRELAALHVAALNHGLRDLPEDRVRFHMCWGSYHGPHRHDIPLRDVVDLILRVRAEAYSIEASNPSHEHEWRVWEDVQLPEGKILIPGVVGHYSDFIEHAELVAERLVRYARLVGRENVIAGTDCGLGGRVGHPSVAWAKLESMAAGARLATQRLWGRNHAD